MLLTSKNHCHHPIITPLSSYHHHNCHHHQHRHHHHIIKKFQCIAIFLRYYRKPRFNKDGFFLVKNGAEYVATAFAWEDGMSSCCGRLLWLAVSPKHRRKGIGKALCHSVLKYHKSSGKRFVWLRIGPTKTRKAAAKLYENVGFIRE